MAMPDAQALAEEVLAALDAGRQIAPFSSRYSGFSAEDAYARIRAGASLVQLYSALVYEGPGLAARIAKALVPLLQRDGFASLSEAVGA